MDKARRHTAKVEGGSGGRSQETAVDKRIRALAEQQVGETAPHLADSRCEGVVVVSFWTGGRLGEQVASVIFISPELAPKAVAPYLRAQADALEGRVPEVDFGTSEGGR